MPTSIFKVALFVFLRPGRNQPSKLFPSIGEGILFSDKLKWVNNSQRHMDES